MTNPQRTRPRLDRSALAQVGAPWRVEIIDETGSTNADVCARARAGEPAGLVLVAEHQTAGRGRLDRSWESLARSALTFSVLLRPPTQHASWPWLPLLTGIAVVHGVRRVTQLDGVTLKWPNDVLLGGRKTAGVLAERVETEAGPAAVVGIGINVAMTEGELPVETATSLAIGGANVERGALLASVLSELPALLVEWSQGTDGLRTAYTTLCETVGQLVEVSLPSGEILSGRAVGVDLGGRLEVETDAGRRAVGAGDVVHVR